MPRLRFPFLLAVCAAALPAGLPAQRTVPRMPPPQFAPAPAAGQGLSFRQIRAQLETVLPAGTRLELGAPDAPGSAVDSASKTEPVPVAISIRRYPVLDFSDDRYAPLDHRFIPVMLDWFEELLTEFQLTPAEARERGLLTNKVARLMRVFVSTRVHRDTRTGPAMAPAIGWCRMYFNEDWGRCRRGETHGLIIVGTDQGWFALDPYTRRMRQLTRQDPRWLLEFIVI